MMKIWEKLESKSSYQIRDGLEGETSKYMPL